MGLGIILALLLAILVLYGFLLWWQLEGIRLQLQDLIMALSISTETDGSPSPTTPPSWLSPGESTGVNLDTEPTPILIR